MAIWQSIPVDVCPGEVVDGVLLVLDGLGHDLGVEVVVKAVVQMGLDGQGLVQELLEEILLGVLTHEYALGVRVLGGSVGPAQHLEDVGDGVVVVGVELAVVELGVHDDDEVGLNGQRPHQRPSGHYNL